MNGGTVTSVNGVVMIEADGITTGGVTSDNRREEGANTPPMIQQVENANFADENDIKELSMQLTNSKRPIMKPISSSISKSARIKLNPLKDGK